MQTTAGLITLLGSGETSLAGGRAFEAIAQRQSNPLRIAILETPAGFELNSAQVAGRVAEFLTTRLQNFNPQINVIPARRRGTPFSTDEATILTPMGSANIIFMGPGSPTYAVRQLMGSLTWKLVLTRHCLGAALVFASAATIAVGAWTLPVYEIYKVGEDVSKVPGLDLFASYGTPLSIIPHWNNSDGGDDVDTSRCFVGLERFNQWRAMLPPAHTVIGLDEHTALTIDPAAGICLVSGVGSITLLRESGVETFTAGVEFPISVLGEFRWPEPQEGCPSEPEVFKRSDQEPVLEDVPTEILQLAEERQRARDRQDWTAADTLRQQMEKLGWIIQDTPTSPKIVRQSRNDIK